MNQLIITGGLVSDPELKTIPGRDGAAPRSVVNVRLAVKRRGGKDAPRDFVNVAIFGKDAETVAKYSAKGRRLSVVGPVELEEWTGKDGTNKASLAMTAREVTIIDWPDRENTSDNAGAEQEEPIAA